MYASCLRSLLCPLVVSITLLIGPALAQDDPQVSTPPSEPLATQVANEILPAVDGASLGEPAPITVWNREIAVLHANLGELSTVRRAQRAVARILALPKESLSAHVDVELVRIGELAAYSFSVDGRLLFSLSELDLDPSAHEGLAHHAQLVRARIVDLLGARVAQADLPQLLRSLGYTVGATVVMLLLVWFTVWLKRFTIRRIRKRAARSERLRVRNLDLRPYVADLLERMTGLANLVAIGTVLYVWLGFCLEMFPYTAPWGDKLTIYLTNLLQSAFLAVAGIIPDLVVVTLICFVTRGVARTVTTIVMRIERRIEREEGVAPESFRATRRIAVVIVWIFGLVFAYPYLPGSHSEAFKGVSVLLGLMVSLGSSGLVNQIMSGFVVLYSKAVRRGEVVRIGEVEGQVTELGFLSTKVLLPSGEEVSLPNALVVTHATTNFSRAAGSGRAVASTKVTIGYDVPWRQVRALLLLAAERTKGITREPGPRVGQRDLGDYYADYALYFQVDDGKQRPTVLTNLHAAIQDAFNEFGVQIMSPHFTSQPADRVVVPHGEEEPEPAPRFRFARESAPHSFDPVADAAAKRAELAALEAEKAERIRLREERELAEDAAKAAGEPVSEADAEVEALEAELDADADADDGAPPEGDAPSPDDAKRE